MNTASAKQANTENRMGRERGFALFLVVIFLVTLALISAVAVRMTTRIERDEKKQITEKEMETIMNAIVGTNTDPKVNFGYFGDVRAFPSSLQYLYTQPPSPEGDEWDGPYLSKDFSQNDYTNLTTDEWGAPYVFDQNYGLKSVGSGDTLSLPFDRSATYYNVNRVRVEVNDWNGQGPKAIYNNNAIVIQLYFTGNAGTKNILVESANVGKTGRYNFQNVKAGNYRITVTVSLGGLGTQNKYKTIQPGGPGYSNLVKFRYNADWP